MPSVFIARHNSAKPIPSFVSKKIPNLMPGEVSQAFITIDAPGFCFPRHLFQHAIHAIATNTFVVAVSTIFTSVFKGITSLTHIYEVPVCSFRFQSLSPSDTARLKAMGLQQDLANPSIFTGTPASHFLSEIHAMKPVDDRIRPGTLVYDAYFAWVYLMKGIQIFTTVQNHVAPTGYNNLAPDGKSYCQGTVPGKVMGMGGDMMELDAAIPDFKGWVYEATNQFYLAKPAANLSSFPGSFAQVDRLPVFGKGIFFPYFSGMLTADKTTAFDVFHSIFTGTLAPNQKADSALMSRIRNGIRMMAFSRTGLVMSHIYKLISMTRDIPGAKLTVVLKGSSYVGSVIEGDFGVEMYGVRYDSSDDVATEIGKTDLLESQAIEICGLLNAVEDIDGRAAFSFVKTDFLTSRLALHSFNSVDPALFHSSDVLDKVRAILGQMDFNDEFPLPSQSMVLAAATYISTGIYAGISQYPAYLGGAVLLSRSRTWEALSMFGPRAPSFNTGDSKGTMISLPRATAEDTNLTKVNGVRPLQYFPFWVVPLNVAVSQWDNAINKGVFSFPKGRKNKKEFVDLHRVAFSIASDPQFSTLYELLKGMADEARAAGVSGNKRKRGANDEDGKGKKKAKASTEDEFI